MKKLCNAWKNANICAVENCRLSRHSSFRIGGAAELAVFPESGEQLLLVLGDVLKRGLPLVVMGNASNVVFDDAGFDGVVIFTSHMRRISWQGSRLSADAGVSLSALALQARDLSLTGLEFAYGIPGTLGGAVFMNAGAFGQEMSDVCVKSEYFDLASQQIGVLEGEAQGFVTRGSFYEKNPRFVILGAELQLAEGNREKIFARMEEQLAKRKQSQPLEFPSAGSVFKRPVGDYAGRLIDACGLKGLTVGGARVSEKHAGFIINTGNATAKEVKELVALIRDRVLKETGVLLECEIRFIDP